MITSRRYKQAVLHLEEAARQNIHKAKTLNTDKPEGSTMLEVKTNLHISLVEEAEIKFFAGK